MNMNGSTRRHLVTACLGVLVVLLPIYFGLASGGQIPRQVNVLCYGDWADSKPSSCNTMNDLARELPACGFDLRAEAIRLTPAKFLQMYWHAVDCGDVQSAANTQSPEYFERNSSPIGEFQDFVTLCGQPTFDAQVVDAVGSKMHPDGLGATVDVKLILGRTPQWITYEVKRDLLGAWIIDYSSEIDKQ